MRTNIVIDEKLLQEAMVLSRAKTKKETVQRALEEFVRNRKRLDLSKIRGKIEFADGYDHKKMRTR
jgi:Arc/MetJ family transcription regulator